MVFDTEKHTITLSRSEVTAILNMLQPFKNAATSAEALEDLICLDDLFDAEYWYNKFLNG